MAVEKSKISVDKIGTAAKAAATSSSLEELKKALNINVSDYYQQLNEIIGLPFHFNDRADPNARTFLSHMFPGATILGIRPGNIKFSDSAEVNKSLKVMLANKDANYFDTDGDVDPRVLFNASSAGLTGAFGVDKDSMSRINAELAKKAKGPDYTSYGTAPIRYFDFDPAIFEYMSYVSTLSGHLFARLTGGSTSWSAMTNEIKTKTGGFFNFWCDGATSVSESLSNEVGESKVGSMIKSISGMAREAEYLLAAPLGDKNTGSAVASMIQGIGSFVSDESAGTIRAGLGEAIQGWIPTFPNMWKGSNFTRDYNLSFKFFTPYGDPYSCYKEVLLPFSMLLALVGPRQSALTSYRSPFVFQLDCPGIFSCDLGMATSMSFVKGGSDQLFGAAGLPRQIDVTLNVVDLYPTLMMSNNTSALYTNTGLLTFLDTLSGINLAYSGANSDIFTKLKSRLATTVNKAASIPDAVTAYGTQMIHKSNLFSR